jgi:hypothetical protein
VYVEPQEDVVQMVPNLTWCMKDNEEAIPSKLEPDVTDINVQGLIREQLGSGSGSSTTTEARSGSSQEDSSIPSVPSSRMSERSGTQSSIELRSSDSRASQVNMGTDGSLSSSHKQETPKSSSSGACEEHTSSSARSASVGSSGVEQSSRSVSATTEDSSQEKSSTPSSGSDQEGKVKKQVKLTDSAEEYPHTDTKSPTSQLKSSGDMSPQSLPSSPRRLRRTASNGVKKMTSEIFSTDHDLSRSLEIVYFEPTTNERRKLSERYRHTSSSSGTSNGEVNAEQAKIEKRKASVTRIRKSSNESEVTREYTPTSQESDTSKSPITTTTTSSEMKIQHISEPQEDVSRSSPLKEKKTASPTKIQTPAPPSGAPQEQISAEVISPFLKVECRTPERKIKDTKCEG